MNWKREQDYEYTQYLPPSRWAWEFLRRNPDYRDCWESGDQSGAHEWGLARLVDPDDRCPEGLRFNLSFGGMIIGGWHSDLAVPLGHVYYDFDITKPLPKQLEKAARDLRLVQDIENQIGELPPMSPTRDRIDKWPRYLRILDAATEETSRAEMAEHLFPDLPDDYPNHKGSKAASNSLRQARGMVEVGYRKILLIQE